MQTCPYCKNEIRPLDQHAHNIQRGGIRDAPPTMLVTCSLSRTYFIDQVTDAGAPIDAKRKG